MDYGYVMTFSTQLHAVPCFVMDTFHLIVTIICLLIIVEEQWERGHNCNGIGPFGQQVK